MKNKSLIKGIFLVALFGFILSAQFVLAAPPGAVESHQEDEPTAGAPGSQTGEGVGSKEKKAGGVPDTFDVNLLTTEGQKSRVPGATTSVEAERQGAVGIIADAISLLVKIVGSISLIVFILGALMSIASEGKSDRLEKGKGIMLYAIYGLLISLFAFIIVTFVESILF